MATNLISREKTLLLGFSRRGFTLVELLVVISIIGLLSSVVLSAVNSARIKADNAGRTSSIGEYKKAFDLYYSANGQYPTPADIISTGVYVVCLGDYPSDTCYNNGLLHESTVLNTALAPYLPSRQTFKPTEVGAGLPSIDSPVFNCSVPSCSTMSIEWYLNGQDQNCGSGIPLPGAPATLQGYSQNLFLAGQYVTACFLNLL